MGTCVYLRHNIWEEFCFLIHIFAFPEGPMIQGNQSKARGDCISGGIFRVRTSKAPSKGANFRRPSLSG